MENNAKPQSKKPSIKTNINVDAMLLKNENPNQVISLLLKIKCDFFLRKLFDNLKKKKTLKINKYNKKIKKRLNLNVYDYIQNSKIEIEIIPKENAYGNIINITKNQDFFQIYFDDKKEEIKKYCLDKNSNIKKIKIVIDPEIVEFSKLFFCCECIDRISLKNFTEIILWV